MKITRVFTQPNGASAFDEVDFPLESAGQIGALSKRVPVKSVLFRTTPGDYDYTWHRAPCRQFVIMLEGSVDVTVSSGECRRFNPGDVLLVEDTTGQGHCSRTVDGMPRKSIFVELL